jgi:hypothetical protein
VKNFPHDFFLITIFPYFCHPEKRGSSLNDEKSHFSSAGRATDL